MDSETREKMVVAFEQLVRSAGAPSFEEGMNQARMLTGIACGWLVFINKFLQPIETLDDLRETLDSRMALSDVGQTHLLFALENLPWIMRMGATALAKKAASTLPPPAKGRKRKFTVEKKHEILDYVSKLNREGVSMDIAKGRAALKFKSSKRSIARIWAERASLPLENPPTIQELIRSVLREAQADGWQTPIS